jgi:hypothetical protein
MCCVMNAVSVVALKSGSPPCERDRTRYPDSRRRPLQRCPTTLQLATAPQSPLADPQSRCRRPPRFPRSGSRAALTIARRSLCNCIQAVSYRRSPNRRLQQERGQAALVGDRRTRQSTALSCCVVENRVGGQRDLIPAGRTLLLRQAIGARVRAPRARVPVEPAAGGQIVLTRFLGGELTLELAHILRKRRVCHA